MLLFFCVFGHFLIAPRPWPWEGARFPVSCVGRDHGKGHRLLAAHHGPMSPEGCGVLAGAGSLSPWSKGSSQSGRPCADP